MIYNDTICLASDCRAIDQTTQEVTDDAIKQTIINNTVAIGFAGSGYIAQRVIDNLSTPDNSSIISKLGFERIHEALDDLYTFLINDTICFPNEESRHLSALICGINNLRKPEIVYWMDGRIISKLCQSEIDHFDSIALSPQGLSKVFCNNILRHTAFKYNNPIFFEKIAADYFKVISSINEFVSDRHTVWIYSVNNG